MHWSIFALMTVLSWGVYGAFLARGAKGFEDDRIKAFLFVGVAYLLVAVLAPLLIIVVKGSGFDFGKHPAGVKWSLIAGTVGALGALTVLFALNSNPVQGPIGASQVMSLVFAGAPVVAAIYGLIMNPPKEGWGSISPVFIAGIVLAAAGGALVTLFKP